MLCLLKLVLRKMPENKGHENLHHYKRQDDGTEPLGQAMSIRLPLQIDRIVRRKRDRAAWMRSVICDAVENEDGEKL